MRRICMMRFDSSRPTLAQTRNRIKTGRKCLRQIWIEKPEHFDLKGHRFITGGVFLRRIVVKFSQSEQYCFLEINEKNSVPASFPSLIFQFITSRRPFDLDG